MSDPLKELSDAGVAIWLDDLSRERLTSGSLQRLTETHHISGVTTNPTIFANAISRAANEYAAQLSAAAARKLGADEAIRELTTYDVRWACDVLHPIYERTGGIDGRISIEVDARYAHQTDATVGEARALRWLVDRENVFIKVPATDQGMPAITTLIAEGISINITLIFSVSRYEQVMAAWLAGLELAHERGLDLSRIHSVASFFISRVDTAADAELSQRNVPDGATLHATLGIANAQLAWAAYTAMRSSARFQVLAAAGAPPQRPLWASTGVKDPDLPGDFYVAGLIGPGIVNTMPEATLQAVAASGTVSPDTLDGTETAAQTIFERFREAGIDTDHIFEQLEAEGIEKFMQASDTLRRTISAALAARPSRNQQDE